LKSEYDFRRIAKKYFDEVEVVTLPAGLSSGVYQISFNIENAKLDGVKRLTEKLKCESDFELAEINRIDQERRNHVEQLIKRETEPFRKKISEFQVLADETDDKYEYHHHMTEITRLHEEISRISNFFMQN
jgi:23S rRNA pseudoU1915 N3-methylase RlmH